MEDTSYGENAYYGQGIYDTDPLVGIQHIVKVAAAHNKPVMISECGFPYYSGSEDTTAYAVDQLTKFYSYVNMIYPQVKAVFYFDIPGRLRSTTTACRELHPEQRLHQRHPEQRGLPV